MRNKISSMLAAVAMIGAPLVATAAPASAATDLTPHRMTKADWVCVKNLHEFAHKTVTITSVVPIYRNKITVRGDYTYSYCHPRGIYWSSRSYARILHLTMSYNLWGDRSGCDAQDPFNGVTVKSKFWHSSIDSGAPWYVGPDLIPCHRNTEGKHEYPMDQKVKYKSGVYPKWDMDWHVHVARGYDLYPHRSGSFSPPIP